MSKQPKITSVNFLRKGILVAYSDRRKEFIGDPTKVTPSAPAFRTARPTPWSSTEIGMRDGGPPLLHVSLLGTQCSVAPSDKSISNTQTSIWLTALHS